MGVDVSLTGVPEFDKLEIVKSGYITVSRTGSSTQQLTDLTHNLGYFPVVFASLSSGTNLPFVNLLTVGADAGKVMSQVSVFLADETKVTFEVKAPNFAGNTDFANSISYTVRYILFRERTTS